MAFHLQWFPFYHADFFLNGKVQAMNLEEIGAYVKLLAYQWREGSIPADACTLTRILGVDDDTFDRIWLRVGKCFEKQDKKKKWSRLINKRMAEEHDKAMQLSDRKREAGRIGGITKAQNRHLRLADG